MRWEEQARARLRHSQPPLPPSRSQRSPPTTPSGPTTLVGPPRCPRRPRGQRLNTSRHHRNGQHVGHSPRPLLLEGPMGLQAR